MSNHQCYRGEYGDCKPLTTISPFIALTSEYSVAYTYATHPNDGEYTGVVLPRIYQVDISINNPFWVTTDSVVGKDEIIEAHPELTTHPLLQPDENECVYFWQLFENVDFLNYLRSKSYDGAIYGGCGCGIGSLEYAILDHSQILTFKELNVKVPK